MKYYQLLETIIESGYILIVLENKNIYYGYFDIKTKKILKSTNIKDSFIIPKNNLNKLKEIIKNKYKKKSDLNWLIVPYTIAIEIENRVI